MRLDAPPLNLLGSPMITAVREAFADLAGSRPRAVVLRCAGGGADVREMATFTPESGRAFITALHEACAAVRALDAPVIAAVDGVCLGAHLELAAACDLRIASEGSRFGMPEINVGLPSVIDAWWITKICGMGAASELFFGGELIDAAEAARIGLINRVAGPGALEDAAVDWAAALASFSPVALAAQKGVLRDWTDAEYRAAASASIDRFAEALAAGEYRDAMNAMLQKRKAVFE
ncbi:MAG TPA: enoyl-CoA hydratase-related protein [Burkholderiales bacterium]|nr:enoyl-CoA hydratase-related protein [Burkholderiales bacterium]